MTIPKRKREEDDEDDLFDMHGNLSVRRNRLFRQLGAPAAHQHPTVFRSANDLDEVALKECYHIVATAARALDRTHEPSSALMEDFFRCVFRNWTSEHEARAPVEPVFLDTQSFAVTDLWHPVGVMPGRGAVLCRIQFNRRRNGMHLEHSVVAGRPARSIRRADMGSIDWHTRRECLNTCHDLEEFVLRDIAKENERDNRYRAIQYARNWLKGRAWGDGVDGRPGRYQFARMQETYCGPPRWVPFMCKRICRLFEP